MAKYHIKKGDLVKVIAGNHRGDEGKVLEIDREKARAIVEGVNKVKRHTKPNAANPNGAIVEKEATVHISNLMIVDPKTGKPTRIGRKVVGDGLVRFSKKSGEVIK